VSKVDLLLVAGARPNFVKLAPLHRAIETQTKLRSVIVHEGGRRMTMNTNEPQVSAPHTEFVIAIVVVVKP
jgi:UDP-N-acetylglucosamine 2-epimerase